MLSLNALRTQIFAETGDIDRILELRQNPLIRGFATSPALIHASGATDYDAFAQELLSQVRDRPISFGVIADDFGEMERQALAISSWAPNANVKLPVANARGESSVPLIGRLSAQDVIVNIDPVFTLAQMLEIADALDPRTPAIVSMACGDMSDSGRDPAPVMRMAREILATRPKAKLLWAGAREALNVYQANHCGCHLVSAPEAVLARLELADKDLNEMTVETVAQRHAEAVATGFTIGSRPEAEIVELPLKNGEDDEGIAA